MAPSEELDQIELSHRIYVCSACLVSTDDTFSWIRQTMRNTYCGNNVLSPKLKQHGGDMDIGNCDTCRRKGYSVGTNVKIHETEFLKEWSEAYAPIVRQLLWYKAGKPPPRYQQATLHQCFGQGFAAASIERAKQLRKQSAVQSRRGTAKEAPNRPREETAPKQTPKQNANQQSPLSTKPTPGQPLPTKRR